MINIDTDKTLNEKTNFLKTNGSKQGICIVQCTMLFLFNSVIFPQLFAKTLKKNRKKCKYEPFNNSAPPPCKTTICAYGFNKIWIESQKENILLIILLCIFAPTFLLFAASL